MRKKKEEDYYVGKIEFGPDMARKIDNWLTAEVKNLIYTCHACGTKHNKAVIIAQKWKCCPCCAVEILLPIRKKEAN